MVVVDTEVVATVVVDVLGTVVVDEAVVVGAGVVVVEVVLSFIVDFPLCRTSTGSATIRVGVLGVLLSALPIRFGVRGAAEFVAFILVGVFLLIRTSASVCSAAIFLCTASSFICCISSFVLNKTIASLFILVASG